MGCPVVHLEINTASQPDLARFYEEAFGWTTHPDGDDYLQINTNGVCAETGEHAGIPHYHPHDLRHRRITLWHGQGIPAREIGERVGQRQVSTTLDIYTYVMPLDEVPRAAYRRLLVRTG